MRFSPLLLILTLAACQEEEVRSYLDPVPLTAEAVGHFCQMGLLEHEGPKAQVHLDGLPGAPLFFSQVRDAVAYTRLPEQSHVILALWVSDMGAPNADWNDPGQADWIALADAHLVVGSRRTGGMGVPELVPFGDLRAAQAFAQAYGGDVMRVAEVPDSAVIAPLIAEDELQSDTEFEQRLNALSSRQEG